MCQYFLSVLFSSGSFEFYNGKITADYTALELLLDKPYVCMYVCMELKVIHENSTVFLMSELITNNFVVQTLN